MVIKLQCPCGAKYSLDATPETAAAPVTFVCQACGRDSSEMVNEIIRQQLGSPIARPPSPSSNLPVGRILTDDAPVAPAPATRAATPVPVAVPQTCPRHPGREIAAHCVICKKPICSKCMELFGYVCSAYCKGQAEHARMEVPVYAGQRTVVEAREWKRIRHVAFAAAALLLALFGLWLWYEAFASKPSAFVSIKLPADSGPGFCRFIEPGQIVFRSGTQLKRYDLKAKREVWSAALVDENEVVQNAAESFASRKAQVARQKALRAARGAANQGEDSDAASASTRNPPSDAAQIAGMAEWTENALLHRLRFHVRGRDIWVASPDRVVRLDWQTGRRAHEVPVPGAVELFQPSDTALLLTVVKPPRQRVVMRIDLATGTAQTAAIAEETAGPAAGSPEPAAPKPAAPKPTGIQRQPATRLGGALAAAQGVRALNDARNQTIADAAADASDSEEPVFMDASRTEFINAGRNVAQLSVRLVEQKIVAYQAMKEAPKQGELDKGVNAANATAAINEILNEWQADRTGGKRFEDESRYAVTIRRLLGEAAPDWTGEVAGPACLFSTATVDVLVAGKTVQVFDKSNRRLWDGKLAFPVSAAVSRPGWRQTPDDEESSPCLERGDTLLLFDQGVLTAFELTSGAVRWRLPSVGIRRVQFDQEGLLYVATTSANVEDLKYTGQVDITRQTGPVLLKVDARTGKTLWRAEGMGGDCHLAGKFVYAVETAFGSGGTLAGPGTRAHVRIWRLDPEDGSPMWEYFQSEYPQAMDFEGSTIQLLFPKQLQVVKFLAL